MNKGGEGGGCKPGDGHENEGRNDSYGSSSGSFTPQSTTSHNERHTSIDVCAGFVRHRTKSGSVFVGTSSDLPTRSIPVGGWYLDVLLLIDEYILLIFHSVV